MEKFRLHTLFFIGIMVICISCQTKRKIKLFENYSDRDHTIQTLSDLFYGMDQDSIGNYYDSELDCIEDLLYKEYREELKNTEDTTSFILSIGLYIDKRFPSDEVKRILLEKVDSVLTEGLSYDLPENELLSLKSQKITIPDSLSLFLDLWGDNFNRLTQNYNLKSYPIEYYHILDSRGCLVCHRIYEDKKWVTYILESSVSYHGSSGCPSRADYITINKQKGSILSKDDILKDCNLESLYTQLPLVYENSAREKGFTPSAFYDGEGLLREADGVALINEGLLVYYLPYHLGCGAEEQYNLVIPLDKLK